MFNGPRKRITTARPEEELTQWAEKQRRNVAFDPPPRLPGEVPITVEQLAEIRHLTKETDLSVFEILGCGQARALILFLREQQEIFTHDLVAQALDSLSTGARQFIRKRDA